MSGLDDIVDAYLSSLFAEGELQEPKTVLLITLDRQENRTLFIKIKSVCDVTRSSLINTLNMESPFLFTVETVSETVETEYVFIDSRTALLDTIRPFLRGTV